MTELNVLGLINGRLDEIAGDVSEVKVILNGNGKLGVVGKVQILWRSQIWILCALSGSAGSLVTWLVTK